MLTSLANARPLPVRGLQTDRFVKLFASWRFIIIAVVVSIIANVDSIAQIPSPNWGLYYYWNDNPGTELFNQRIINSSTVAVPQNLNAGIGGFNTAITAYPIEQPKRLFHIYSHKIPQYAGPDFLIEPAYLRIQSDVGLATPLLRPLFSPAGIEFFAGRIDGDVDEQSATIQSCELNIASFSTTNPAKFAQIQSIYNSFPVMLETYLANPRGLDILTKRKGATRGLLSNGDQIRSIRVLTGLNDQPYVGIGNDAPLERLQLGDHLTFHTATSPDNSIPRGVAFSNVIGHNIYYDPTVGKNKRILNGPTAELSFWENVITLGVLTTGNANDEISFQEWNTGRLEGMNIVAINNPVTGISQGCVSVGVTYPLARLDVHGLSGSGSTMAFRVTSGDQKQLIRAWDDGRVSIGHQSILSGNNIDYKLSVDGKLVAKEIVCTVKYWADYVFDEDYKPMPIEELDAYVKKNKHLPEIPTTAEVMENGVQIGDMNASLLKKIEELTLYVIEMKKEVNALKQTNSGTNNK
ncbi:MAG: hypothetical protein HYZ54_13600 [Ignavibacteriae bacterium]|nr:hypothetical protein [Ignavibacteriota bacterium]